jgi:hypothetical protein
MPKPRPVSKAKLDAMTEQLVELIRVFGLEHAMTAWRVAIGRSVAISLIGQRPKRGRGRPKANEEQRTASEMLDFIAWFRIECYLAEHPQSTVRKAAAWLSSNAYPSKKSRTSNTLRMRHSRIVALHEKDPERAKRDRQFLTDHFGIETLDT